jgi:hypothetical protein
VLEAVARRGEFYEVVLPIPDGTSRTGFIAVSQVQLVAGTPAPPRTNPASPSPQTQTAPVREPTSLDVGFRPYGQIGYGWLAASQSFEALLGHAGGFSFGGGGNYRFANGLFLQGSVDIFRHTGQRVFAFEGQVFQLGTPDTVTMIPLAGTAGYRFRGRKVTPYVGGGLGTFFYKESPQSAEPSDEVSSQFLSYHALGGIEVRGSGRFGTAIEAEYTHVPNELASGVGDVFNEHDLVGLQLRFKLLFGR